MITDCFGARQWDLSDTEAIFVRGILVLLKVVWIHVAVSVFTWKISRPGRAHQRASILGLEAAIPHPGSSECAYELKYSNTNEY